MATHASAIKRHRQNLKRRARNRHFISIMRGQMKSLRQLITDKKGTEATGALKDAISIIYRTASKGVIKKGTASRYVSRLASQVAHLASPGATTTTAAPKKRKAAATKPKSKPKAKPKSASRKK